MKLIDKKLPPTVKTLYTIELDEEEEMKEIWES